MSHNQKSRAKKQFKVHLSGKQGVSYGIRTCHAENEKDAEKVARELYPYCNVDLIERIK